MTERLAEFTSLRAAWHPDGQRVSLWGNHRRQGLGFWTVPLAGAEPVRSEFASTVTEQLKEARVSFANFQWAASGDALYFEGVSASVKSHLMLGAYRSFDPILVASFDEIRKVVTKNIGGMRIGSYSLFL